MTVNQLTENNEVQKGIERVLKVRFHLLTSIRFVEYDDIPEILNILGFDHKGNQYYVGFVDTRYKKK